MVAQNKTGLPDKIQAIRLSSHCQNNIREAASNKRQTAKEKEQTPSLLRRGASATEL
jgi:hypothetical protein